MKAVFCAGLKGRILYDCLRKIFGAFEKGGCMGVDGVSCEKFAFFDIFSFFFSEKEVGKKKGGRGQDKKVETQAGQESSDDEDSNQAGECV